MLVSLSANHKNTSFETLERLSTLGDIVVEELVRAHETIRGTVVISTCNRFEAYFDVAEGEEWSSPVPAMNSAIDEVARLAELPARQVREAVDFSHGSAVAHHLFSVAAGLESVVVGEDEIAGQVRRALDAAREVGTTTSELEALFQRATETSRSVRNTAQVAQAGRSIVRLALQLASSRIDDWSEARVLLVGTGRYAAASLASLRDVGATDIRVHSVSSRGERFAASRGVPLVGVQQYPAEAAMADVVVACTTADHFVLDSATLQSGRALVDSEMPSARPARQLVIDLGLPRNIDPDVADIDGVDLLDLETIRIHAPIDEFSTLSDAREIVEAATRRFAHSSRAQDLSPAIVALRRYVHELADEEIARASKSGEPSREAENAIRHFSSVLLHRAMVRGQELAAAGDGQDWVDGLEAVLGIDVPAGADAAQDERGDEGIDLGSAG